MVQPNALCADDEDGQRLGFERSNTGQRFVCTSQAIVSDLGVGVELAKRWEMEALEAA